jgi:drug/metabolite transporter, DME family
MGRFEPGGLERSGRALLWGTTGTAQSFAPPTLASAWVGALRLVVAAAFFCAVLLAFERRLPRALPWAGIAAAAACMTAYNLAFFAGVRASGVAVGTAIALGSGPLWAGLLQALFLGRRPAPAWWAGTAVAIVGGAALVAGVNSGPALSVDGIGLCLTAGLSYAIYALVNQRLVARAAPALVTAAIFALAALLALPLAAALAGAPTLTTRDLLIVGWLGVMATGVAYLLLSHALRHVSGATAVALALAEPVTAFVLALAIVGERPAPLAFAGLAAVLAGLTVVVRAELSEGPGRPQHTDHRDAAQGRPGAERPELKGHPAGGE